MMLTLSLVLWLSWQAPPQAPLATAPDGCVSQVRQFVQAAQRAATPLTADVVRRIDIDKTDLARRCANQFTLNRTADADMPGLITLYAEAGLPDRAAAAVAHATASRTMPAEIQAQVLSQAIAVALREPRSDARNRRLESWAEALDHLPGNHLGLQVSAHARLNGYYRSENMDAGIIKHSTWLIDRGPSFTTEQRGQFGSAVVLAFINLAEVFAGQGHIDRARALLDTAGRNWSDVRNATGMLTPVIARYALVGSVGAPIHAARWLNAPAGTTLPMTGAVTLLEFTAHWCGPCKESYPGIKRLLARFGARGFRVVMATELYGYFGADTGLSAEREFALDRDYFASEGLAVPIAVQERLGTPIRNRDGSVTSFENPNDTAYQVGAIPQIHIIDRQGRIRLIMVGYDEANEPALAALIDRLLKEN